MNLSDEQIVAKVINGETDLYEQIVQRYQDKLKRYIKRLTNRPLEVDDLVQEVFIKTYKNLRRFNPKLQFSSWIYRIAHNESVNLIKSSWIQKITSIEPLFFIGKEDKTEAEIDRKQLQKQINSCLNRLEVKYKEPLVLYYFENKSYEEISDILRTPVKTVGVLIYRGKLKLKSLCQTKIK